VYVVSHPQLIVHGLGESPDRTAPFALLAFLAPVDLAVR